MAVELKARFSLDTSQVSKAMRAMHGIGAGFNRNFGTPIADAAKKTMALAAGAATTAGVLTGLAVRGAVNYADAIGDVSARTGMSVDLLSKLGYAASTADVPLDTLGKIALKTQKAISLAGEEHKKAVAAFDKKGYKAQRLTGTGPAEEDGAKQAAAFEELGLSWSKLKAMSPDAQFMAVAKAIGSVKSQTDRVRLATQLYGKGGESMLELLAGGYSGLAGKMAQARRLGIVISPAQAEAADKFKASMAALKGSLMGLALEFTNTGKLGAVIDKLTGAFVRLRNSALFKQIGATFNRWIDTTVQGVNAAIGAWNSLSTANREQLQHMLVAAGAFAVAWKTGWLQPIINGIGKVVFSTKAGFAATAAALVGLGSFIIGYKIGEALEKSFNISGMLVDSQQGWTALAKVTWEGLKGIKRMIGTGDFDKEYEAMKKGIQGVRQELRSQADAQKDVEKFTKPTGLAGFMTEMQREFLTVEGWTEDIKKFIPDSVRKFFETFRQNMANIPDLGASGAAKGAKGMADELGTATEKAKELKAALEPLRGFSTNFGRGKPRATPTLRLPDATAADTPFMLNTVGNVRKFRSPTPAMNMFTRMASFMGGSRMTAGPEPIVAAVNLVTAAIKGQKAVAVSFAP